MICEAKPQVQHGVHAGGARRTLFLLMALTTVRQFTALEVRRSSESVGQGASPTLKDESAADVYYLTRMGDRFMNFAARHKETVEQFHNQEQDRLEKAILHAKKDKDRSLLESTIVSNEESRMEARNAFNEMTNFVTTLKQAMGALGSAKSCEDLTCGAHAFCTQKAPHTAYCRCEEGFEGDGFVCKSPLKFVAHSLLTIRARKAAPEVADLHITNLPGNYVAVVFRDVSNMNKGFIMLGHADMSRVQWHAPVLFSNQSQAFSPILVPLLDDGDREEDHGVAIAFRDQNLGGAGILLGGRINPRTNQVAIGDFKAFARHQAQEMSVIPLPLSRVAVFFAEHRLGGVAGSLKGGAMYGTALLAQVHTDTALPPLIMSKQHFISGPVARITAQRLTPTSFAVAYRQGQTGLSDSHAEASCIVGQMKDSELFFNAAPVLLDPEQSQIWARSLALIGDNTFTYTYHSGNEQVTKQAVLRADPRTHHLTVQQPPEVIAQGFTPFVGSVSNNLVRDLGTAAKQKGLQLVESGERRAAKQSTKLFTYFTKDGPKNAQARLCGVNIAGIPDGCRNIDWSGQEMLGLSGTTVEDGRVLFVFTDTKGKPFYQLVGL